VAAWEVTIDPGYRSADEVVERLTQLGLSGGELAVEVRQPFSDDRALDPAIIVAAINAASSTLVIVITALLQPWGNRTPKQIVIETAKGTKIVIPAGTSPADVAAYVKAAEPVRLILPNASLRLRLLTVPYTV
jgi:hypothetical protein